MCVWALEVYICRCVSVEIGGASVSVGVIGVIGVGVGEGGCVCEV